MSRYPGAHKHRFDENGYGRGLSGRRNPNDVLSMVWQSTNSLDDPGNEGSTFVWNLNWILTNYRESFTHSTKIETFWFCH